MNTLVLVSVVGTMKRFPVVHNGLYYIILEGDDYEWINGMKLQETNFGDPNYERLKKIIFRDGKPGEPYQVFRKELKLVLKFPAHENLRIVHCETWS